MISPIRLCYNRLVGSAPEAWGGCWWDLGTIITTEWGGHIVVRILVLTALVALAGTAAAETVDISFPELTGDFETGWVPPETAPTFRSTTFIFPPDVQSMEGMRLIISGAFEEGIVICSNSMGPPDTTSFTAGLTLMLTAPGVFEGFFYATIVSPHEPFSNIHTVLQYCCPSGPGNPNLLLGEIINVALYYEHPLILPCNIDVDSFGTLTEVRLQALGAVPTDEHTWGNVKALYR
jgi:hypothetical protein